MSTFAQTDQSRLVAISTLTEALDAVFQDKELYRRFLACRSSDAQRVLDSLQMMLDEPSLELPFRRKLIVATQRLSVRSTLYPMCHNLKDVTQIGSFPVAAGGFADIYKGMFQGKVVCMKVIRLYEQSQIEHVLKKFSKEILLWGQMLHPNVLTIFGLYKFRNRLSLVMPWIENGNIAKYLKAHPDAPRPLLAKDVSAGLSYLHQEGVIHGDLKSANVLVDDAGRACLADFGISAVSDPDIIEWTTQSKSISSGGSVRWQAPELFLAGDSDNEAETMKNTTESDVYAWGCVCLEIFTDQIPFASIPNDVTVMVRVQSGGQPPRPPASSLCWSSWGLTEELWTIMKRCWAKNPLDRPSASAIATYFEANNIQDSRTPPETDWISSAIFRRVMNKPVDVISVEDLYHILSDSPITPSMHMISTFEDDKRKHNASAHVSHTNTNDNEENEPKRHKGEISKLQTMSNIRKQMVEAFAECHRAVLACEDENGRKRCELFRELPKPASEIDDLGYYRTIAQPIALSQINERANSNYYITVEAYRDDWKLMFENARAYYHECSWVYVDADEMEKVFDSIFNRVIIGSGLPGAAAITTDNSIVQKDTTEHEEYLALDAFSDKWPHTVLSYLY